MSSPTFSQVFTYVFPYALLSIINFISDEPKKHHSLLWLNRSFPECCLRVLSPNKSPYQIEAPPYSNNKNHRTETTASLEGKKN
jgi:hypothetical protein